MKISDSFSLTLKRLFNKNNIVLCFILSLIITCIFVCLTMMYFSINFNTNLSYTEDGRTVIVNRQYIDDEENILKSIEHVELVDSKKFQSGAIEYSSQFDVDNYTGEIEINALLLTNEVEIIKGRNIENNGEIIIPQVFYPYDINNNIVYDETYGWNFKEEINKKLIINGESLIGNYISIENTEYGSKTFKVVGVYKNKILKTVESCYISKEDFNNLVSDVEVYTYSEDKYGNITDEKYQMYDEYYMIRVDKRNNLEPVINKLKSLGYTVDQVSYDEENISLLLTIPIYISIIILIISILIIISFLKKNIIKNNHYYGVLKSVGFTNKNIYKLNIIEGEIIYIISIIIASIISICLYYYISYNYLVELIYNNYYISIPWLYIIIFIILFAIIIGLLEIIIARKYLNNCIQNLFEGE